MSVNARIKRLEPRIRTFADLLLAWFPVHGRAFPWRRSSTSSYARVVSEVLLQRTRAETVAAFYPAFMRRFPGWRHLAAATDADLRTFLEPIGLWRRRAASLRALGREMLLRRGRLPSTRDQLESLPGVGQYIASSAMLLCHNYREPLLDVNMARVLERCFAPRKLADIRIDPWLQALARAVVDHELSREVNWAILDRAAAHCRPRNPLCAACPVRSCCRFAASRRGSGMRAAAGPAPANAHQAAR